MARHVQRWVPSDRQWRLLCGPAWWRLAGRYQHTPGILWRV